MTKKTLPIFMLTLFVFISTSSSYAVDTSRGIRVVSKEGKSLVMYKDYYALVVGISDYEQWPRLPNAVNDAKEVGEKLKEMGFEVRLVLDPTHREMVTALNEMVYVLGNHENRAVLFYYAGHGETETLADKTKMGYIIPKDCPLMKGDPMGFATHAVSMRDIESASMRIKAKHVIMFFDSCFSGSLFALVRAVPHDISEKSALPVRQYITAGREDEQVPDKSMFKRCLLIGLEGDADLTGDGYITGSEMGMYLSDKVINYTHRRQHPQYGKINNPDLDRGDFVFVPPRMQESQAGSLDAERAAIATELERLREERKRNEELMEQVKELLDAKARSEATTEETPAEKEDLRQELKRVEEERKQLEDKMAAEVQALEEKLLAAEAKLRKQSQEKAGTTDKRVAYVPKEVKDAEIQRIKLRATPSKSLEDNDIREMLGKHGFVVSSMSQRKNFPNDFVDNGDGTTTDRRTGLMWEKEGCPREVSYPSAEKYVSELNERRFVGYDDWRIPTLEELCSLLEPRVNKKGLYTDKLFNNKQKICWTSDSTRKSYGIKFNYTVDFTKGNIHRGASDISWRSDRHFIRAVRTER